MEPVRVGVIGLGWWGGELIRGATSGGALVPVACFARSAESRQAFADKHNATPVDTVEEIYNDPTIDAVVVATPHSTHVDYVVPAAEAGKHVFVDKPFAMSVADGRRCVAAAAAAGVVLQVGHQRRRQTANRRIKSMIDGGELGTVIALEANYSAPGGGNPAADNWRQDPGERPLSGLTPFGVHVIDTFHYFVGPVVKVGAISTRPFGKTSLDDGAIVTFQFESGAIGTLLTSTTVPSTNRVGAMGTAGAAWNDQDGVRLLLQDVAEKAPREDAMDQTDVIAEQMTDFARCIREGSSPEVDGQAGLRVVAVMEAALRSAESGALEDVEAV